MSLHFVFSKPKMVHIKGGLGDQDTGLMLEQVTGDKQQDGLPYHITASAGVLRAAE